MRPHVGSPLADDRRTARLLALVLVAGCGRIRFDERADATTGETACTAIAGLVARFPMEPADLAAPRLVDRSGHGRDGTIVGTVTTMPGQRGTALAFDPSGVSYIDIGAPVGPTATIALWFHRASLGADGEDLFNVPQAPRLGAWIVGTELCINTQNGECWGLTDATLLGRWVHVAVTLRSGLETANEIHVDGVRRPLACVFGTCNIPREVRSVLRLGASDVYAFHGALDDVRVYDRALTDAEVIALRDDAACAP